MCHACNSDINTFHSRSDLIESHFIDCIRIDRIF